MIRAITLSVGVAAVITIFFAFFGRILIVAFISCLLLLGNASSDALSPIAHNLRTLLLNHSDPLVKRGFELREAVVTEFERLENQPTMASRNLDSIVSECIPPGTSFQDALTILNAADTTIKPPSSYTYGHQQHFVVTAEFTLKRYFVGHTFALFVLETDPPNPKATVVKEARGQIDSTSL
jgi:hypothetical protein